MKRSLLFLVAAALLLPGAARSAACTPLNCAPSQFAVQGSTLIGYRSSALGRVTIVDLRSGKKRFLVPGGYVDGHLLVHQAGRQLAWYDLRSGTRMATTTLPWQIRLAGASQDGTRAVGFRLTPDRETTVVVASAHTTRELVIPGRQWDFDALSGNNVFLIHYLTTGGYTIRLLDLATGKLAPQLVKDPRDSSPIWGSPFSRLSSADGRYLFTIYLASNGAAMVHELDVRNATARCIDLPGTGDYTSALSWGMALSRDGRTLWAANPGYRRVVGIDVRSRRVTSAFRVDLPYWNLVDGTRAAVSPDGRQLALADGETVALLGLSKHELMHRFRVRTVAIGWSPTGLLQKLHR